MGQGLNRFMVHAATLGPIGRSPMAPGTLGTLAGLAFIALARMSPTAHIAACVIVSAFGIMASERAAIAIGRKDPGEVVIDEVAGIFIATALLPLTWGYLLAAFVLFRAFDILKPPPINISQRLPGGYGIMVDDIIAGIFANACIRLWIAFS